MRIGLKHGALDSKNRPGFITLEAEIWFTIKFTATPGRTQSSKADSILAQGPIKVHPWHEPKFKHLNTIYH